MLFDLPLSVQYICSDWKIRFGVLLRLSFLLQPTLPALWYHFKTDSKSLISLCLLWDLIFWKFWSIFFVDFFPLSLQLSTSCQFLAWHCCCLQIFYFSLKLFHKVFLLQSENWNCKLFQPFAYLTQFLVFCALWAIRTSKLAYGLCTDLSFRNQKS